MMARILPDLIGANDPASREGGNACDDRKRGRHTDKERKATPAKGLVGTGKYERQDRQDAGAEIVSTPPA